MEFLNLVYCYYVYYVYVYICYVYVLCICYYYVYVYVCIGVRASYEMVHILFSKMANGRDDTHTRCCNFNFWKRSFVKLYVFFIN